MNSNPEYWHSLSLDLHAEADRTLSIDCDVETALAIRRDAVRAETRCNELKLTKPSPAQPRRDEADDDPQTIK